MVGKSRAQSQPTSAKICKRLLRELRSCFDLQKPSETIRNHQKQAVPGCRTCGSGVAQADFLPQLQSPPKWKDPSVLALKNSWVAVKELNLRYYIGETLLITIYTHYGNLI